MKVLGSAVLLFLAANVLVFIVTLKKAFENKTYYWKEWEATLGEKKILRVVFQIMYCLSTLIAFISHKIHPEK